MSINFRAFGSPLRYVQGPGCLAQLGDFARQCGATRALVVADAVVQRLLRPALEAPLAAAGVAAEFAEFGGECTAAEIDRLAAQAAAVGADLIIGAGGGKAIDAAKGSCIQRPGPLFIVPTIASNDSPTSRVVVVYTEQHQLHEVRRMNTNPDLVLVDTTVLVAAPERFFIAGIGDALSKTFEAAQCAASGGLNFYGGHPPLIARAIADAGYATLRQHAEGALAAVRRGQADAHFENAVEATTLLSGLAFENGGLSIAHALTRGFSIVPGVADALHGEQVAFGLLVQLLLEGRPREFIDDLLGFYARVGLPRSLRALGLKDDAAPAARLIAQDSWQRAPYARHLSAPVDAARIEAALLAADQLQPH